MRNRLYRYSNKKYNDLLLNDGSLKIGTLHDFRSIEHKAGISDPNEGMKTVSHYIDYYSPDNESEIPSINARAMETVTPGMLVLGKGSSMHNITIAREFKEPNCFVHCSSYVLSADVMSQFEGANSCVEIFDVRGFYRQLTRTINKTTPVEQFLQCRITYKSREENWNGQNFGLHPSFIKEDQFERQYEYRVIWIPASSDSIAPIIINEPKLKKFCRAAAI